MGLFAMVVGVVLRFSLRVCARSLLVAARLVPDDEQNGLVALWLRLAVSGQGANLCSSC